jgi:lipopolysaccharide transport system ATP-binding protein
MPETVIEVDGISKLYRLGEVGTGSLAHDVNRWWHRVRGKEDPYSQVGQVNDRAKKADSNWVWALKDINFEVNQGEVLGIIGRNGAGKSTLLKILSRVTGPSSGEVRVKGRIASLLEVGTGFHPELTGRENIFLNGAILGMTRAEIRGKLDEIVGFSGCEAYLDTPVKRYSSGMQVRLAFAVAAHLEPEILIVDEVLAVGDAEFQKRCIGRMSEVAREGRTVLFVSHNMTAVSHLCTRAMIIEKGGIALAGPTGVCLDMYHQTFFEARSDWERVQMPNQWHSLFLKARGALVESQSHQELKLVTEMVRKPHCETNILAFDIKDSHGTTIMQALTSVRFEPADETETHVCEVVIRLPALIPGQYRVDLWMGPHNDTTHDQVESAIAFEIVNSPVRGRTFPHSRDHGWIVPECRSVLSSKTSSSGFNQEGVHDK